LASTSLKLWIYLVLFLTTVTTYYPVHDFSFVQYDDPDYILNPHVRVGITRDSLRWAFASGESSNWFPVTRLSHLIDAHLFGLESGWHHLTSLILHAVSVLLLFAFFQRSTGTIWRGALVALLFAIHPLHVESVAWIAERKDVLSALFWFLTLLTYVRYAKHATLQNYLLVILSFVFALMSKPMVVTLPFVLILLDHWPLNRRALREKVPFFFLSAIGSVVAFYTQKNSGALEMIHAPIITRIANAIVTYDVYITKMFWPTNLAVLYPYPSAIPLWQSASAALVLIGITALSISHLRDRPYLFLGWFWYLGTLVPVIGIVQIGLQSHADRYTYIPMIGLFIMLSWGAADLAACWPSMRPVLIAATAIVCVLLIATTEIQLEYWRNSETLYRRAIAVTENNETMHYGLAVVLEHNSNRIPEAIAEYRAALAANPNYWEAHDNLATLLAGAGQSSEAIEHYRAALTIRPNSAQLHNNLAAALARLPSRQQEAIDQFRQAIVIQPNFVEAHTGLAEVLAAIPGRLPDAIAQYETALHTEPSSPELHTNLAVLLARDPARIPEAIAQCEDALRIQPSFVGAHYTLGMIFLGIPGRSAEAISHLEIALRSRANPQLQQLVDRLRASIQER
jgi:tetratricopeptide (TPR) repeat protein